MGALGHSWAAQLLVWLLRDGDGPALLGDLAEEHARRSQAGRTSEAAQFYRYQLYASLTAVLRRRLLEWVRAVPWGTTAAAYVAVVVLELGSVWLLSWLRPGVAPATSALRLVMEFPGIVAIAYVATRVHRSAAFVLGGLMLGVAVLMLSLGAEALSGAFAIAFLTVGPIAAVLGWLLHRRWSAVAAATALLIVTGSAHAQEVTAATDPTKAGFGEMSSRAPQELSAFAFFIGKWEGLGKTRLPTGKIVEYPLTWTWRYILDGTVIADEVHATAPDGTHVVGISFRQYDRSRKAWVVEFLAEPSSQFFPQVRPGVGSVTVNRRNVTVINGARSEAPSRRLREHYQPAPDNDSWVYRLDESNDGGTTWNEGRTEYTLRRSK